MSDNQQLPPVGHVHFPVPIFEPDLFPLPETEDSVNSKIEELKWQVPRSTPLIHHSGFHQPRPHRRHHAPGPFQSNPLKHTTSSGTPSRPNKAEFNFIEVHDSSGKLNSSARSHVRSVVMRKHHEQRRNLPKPAKSGLRNLAPSCNHGNDRPLLDLQPELDIKPLIGRNGPRFNRVRDQKLDPKTKSMATGIVACTECGRTQPQTQPITGNPQLIKHIAGLRTPLDGNFGDPFDSAAISLTPRTRELAHHCKFLYFKHTFENMLVS